MKIDDRARFFDYRPWQEAGGDHPEGNDRYFLPATVVVVRSSYFGEEVVDIRFDHEPDKISYGHFTTITLPAAARRAEGERE